MIKNIINDSIFSLINKVFYFLLKTISIIIIINYTESSITKVFIICLSIIEIMRVIIDFGIDTHSIRIFARLDIEEKTQHVNIILRQKIIFGIVSALIVCTITYFIYKSIMVFLIILAMPFTLIFNLPICYYQSMGESYKLIKNITLSTLIMGMILGVGGIFLKENNFSIVLYLINEIIFSVSVLYALFKNKIIRFNINYSIIDLFKLYKGSLYIGMTAMIVIIYSRADNFILTYLNSQQLDLYATVFRFVEPFLMVFSVFSTVLYATLARNNLRHKSIFIILLIVILVLVFIGFMYWRFIGFIMPYVSPIIRNEILLSDKVLLILILVVMVKCNNSVLTALVLSKGMFKISFISAIFSFVVAIPTLFIFIKKFDILGSGYALIFTEITSFLFLFILLVKNRNVK